MEDVHVIDKEPLARLFQIALTVLRLMLCFFSILVAAVAVGRMFPPPPQIAFQSNRTDNWDVFVADLSRSLDVRLTFVSSFDYSPVWSPDGTRVAFVSSRTGFYDIYMLDLAQHGTFHVTHDPSAETDLYWIDAQTLRYKVMGEIESGDYLYQVNLQSGERQFLGSEVSFGPLTVVSPDAMHAASTKIERGNVDIAVWSVQATGEGRIAAHATNENYPAWSGDSQWLAFASDRDGNWEIYIASLDGNHVRRVTFNGAQDILPSWRPGPQVR